MRYAWLLALAACGRSQPDGKAVGCVVELAAKHGGAHGLISAIADYATPAQERALGQAILDHHANGQFEPSQILADTARELARHGARDDARAILAKLGPLPGVYEEAKARVGLPVDDTIARSLPLVVAQVVGGDLDGAARTFAAHPPGPADQPYDVVAALVALGRDDEARAALAATTPDSRWLALMSWAEVALELHRGVGPAIDALVAARGDRDVGDRVRAAKDVLGLAHGLGEDADVAPLRKALLDDPVRNPTLDEMLVDLAMLAGEQPTVTGDPVLTAIDRGDLDATLAALAAYRDRGVATRWARAWLRFGDRVTDAVCAAK